MLPTTQNQIYIPRRPRLPSLVRLIRGRLHDNDDDKRSHRETERQEGHQHDRPPTSRKLALLEPVLALEIPVVAQEEDQDADCQERRAQRLPHRHQRRVRGAGRSRQERVEPEELRNGDTYGCEPQRGPEPGEECAFCMRKSGQFCCPAGHRKLVG